MVKFMQFTYYIISIFCSPSLINILLKWVACAFILLLPNSLSQSITEGHEKVLNTDNAGDIPAVADLSLRYYISPCVKCSLLVENVCGMHG
jgi:hypothetical protein